MGIFNRVIEHFSRPQDPSPVNDNSRLLAQLNQFSALIHLQDQRQLLEVLVPEHQESFQTMIVGVDLYNHQLLIDELSPGISHPEDLVGHNLTLRHHSGRQKLELNEQVLHWDETNHCLGLSLSETIKYQPRRSSTRLEISGNGVISCNINPLYGAPMHGSILNISEGGMRVLVPGDWRSNLQKNKLLRQCQFTLDNGVSINARGRVKAFSYQGRPYRRTEISIAFEQLSDKVKLDLAHYIHCVCQAA